jgi:hypothetical protein
MYKHRINGNPDLKLLQALPVSRGKIVIAAVLIGVMGVMWIRLILSGKGKSGVGVGGPAAAAAANAPDQAGKTVSVHLSYIELPVIKGRHDALGRDLFTSADWSRFTFVDGAEPGKVSPEPIENRKTVTADDIGKIEAMIPLNGIIASENSARPEAFIDNKLVSTGSIVPFEYNGKTLELVVTEIYKNKVVLRWENFTINVKMPQVD